jgi:hypothetical protein
MMTEQNYGEVPGYRQHPAYANSDLRYLHSPKLFQLKKSQKLTESSESYQKTGSLLDEYILSNSTFFDKYIVKDEELVTPSSANQKNFVQALIDRWEELKNQAFPPSILHELHGAYYKKTSEKDALDLFKSLKPYIEFLFKAEGKTICSPSDLEQATYIYNNITRNATANSVLYDDPNIERYFHHHIIGMPWLGLKWKGELDFLGIDRVNKIIYNVDLKSTSKSITSFPYYYNSYNYDRQQALYRKLIQWWVVDQGRLSKEEMKDYTIKTLVLAVKTTDLNEIYWLPVPEIALIEGETKLIEASELIKHFTNNGWEDDEVKILDFEKVYV